MNKLPILAESISVDVVLQEGAFGEWLLLLIEREGEREVESWVEVYIHDATRRLMLVLLLRSSIATILNPTVSRKKAQADARKGKEEIPLCYAMLCYQFRVGAKTGFDALLFFPP